MRSKFTILIFLSFVLTGCGYTTHSLLPPHVKTIHVDNFKNSIDITGEFSEKEGYDIYRPGLEVEMTKAVIDRFVFDGNLRVVSGSEADSRLAGELIDYAKEPLRYDDGDNVIEYRIKVVARAGLKDLVNNKVLWSEDDFVGEATYRTSGSFAKTEDTARQEALVDLARRIVERTIELW